MQHVVKTWSEWRNKSTHS